MRLIFHSNVKRGTHVLTFELQTNPAFIKEALHWVSRKLNWHMHPGILDSYPVSTSCHLGGPPLLFVSSPTVMNTPSENCYDFLEELGLGINPPPAPKHNHRHPQSDPKEFERNHLVQCQYCFEPKTSGVTLLRCGACKVEIYCVNILLH